MFNKLFTRFALIVILPIIILQSVLVYVFYVRHWENVSSKMEKAVIGEIISIIKHTSNEKKFSDVVELSELMGFSINFYPEETFESQRFLYLVNDPYLNNFIKNIEYHANAQIKAFYFEDKTNISLFAEIPKGVININFSNKRLFSPTTYIFVLWMICTATFLLLTAVIFMRNQVKSILKLADAAEKLGKGLNVENFKPTGASEIRAAGKAFLLMKNRIERQIYFRTQMLAHISHDLRTPLTRIRLDTEFIKNRKIAKEINSEISKMEQMVNEYLNFAKQEGNEKNRKFNLIKLLHGIFSNYRNDKIQFQTSHNVFNVNLKKQALSRAIINLIDNALKYANSKVIIKFYIKENNWYLEVDDDGMGIPKEYYRKVFKPFFKIEESTKGFGLGLAIVKSIVYGHGGKIALAKSSFGGLSVIIKIPV